MTLAWRRARAWTRWRSAMARTRSSRSPPGGRSPAYAAWGSYDSGWRRTADLRVARAARLGQGGALRGRVLRRTRAGVRVALPWQRLRLPQPLRPFADGTRLAGGRSLRRRRT